MRFITWQRNRLLGFSATSFPVSAPREIQKPAKVPWKSLTSGRDSPLSGLFQKRITTPLLREEQYCLKHSPFAHVLTCKSCSLRGSGAVKSSQWDDLFLCLLWSLCRFCLDYLFRFEFDFLPHRLFILLHVFTAEEWMAPCVRPSTQTGLLLGWMGVTAPLEPAPNPPVTASLQLSADSWKPMIIFNCIKCSLVCHQYISEFGVFSFFFTN